MINVFTTTVKNIMHDYVNGTVTYMYYDSNLYRLREKFSDLWMWSKTVYVHGLLDSMIFKITC